MLALSLNNATVALSAYKKAEKGDGYVRLCNYSDRAQTATLTSSGTIYAVTLAERRGKSWEPMR